MKLKIILLLVFIQCLSIGDINAGRSSGRSSTHGSSRHSYSHSSTSSKSKSSHGTSNKHASNGFGSSSNNGAASTSQHNKNVNKIFLESEGGGRQHPSQTKPSISNTYPQPSAPSTTQMHQNHPGTHNQQNNIGFPTNTKQNSLPYTPSAPPDHILKPVTTPERTHGISSGHQSIPIIHGHGNSSNRNPSWSNPYLNTNQSPMAGSQKPIGLNGSVYPHNPSAPYPSNTYNPSAPYPSNTYNPSAPYPSNTYNPSAPVIPGSRNPPYPIQPNHPFPSPTVPNSNPPYPNPPFSSVGNPGSLSSISYSNHPISSVPSGSHFPTSSANHYPAVGPPPYSTMASGNPIGNPYTTHPTNPYSASGTPLYPQQGHLLAQPAMQPYVPGQTMMVIGQQDSGRGLGQIFKEALVFSAVNAGVNAGINRLINPSHYHNSDVKPAEGTTGTTTHITYNNQYFNGYPINGSMPQDTGNTINNPTVYNPSNVLPGSAMPNPIGSYNTAIPNVPVSSNMGSVVNAGEANQANTATNIGLNGVRNDAPLHTTENNSTKHDVSSSNTIFNNIPQYAITDNDLWQISENLFAQEEYNMSTYITINLQAQFNSSNVTDVAKEPLLHVKPEAYDIPSIRAIRALYDNYEFNSEKKENVTFEKRKEENLLLDVLLNTNLMNTAMRWLSNRGFIDPDDFERKDVLRHIWFNQFHGATSGFERVFTSEIYSGTDILGVQDWIYFDYKESLQHINYMGYVDKINLGNKASLVKLNFQMNEVIRPNVTIFIGTMPELEMSLYTICFYARPNNVCPVSLGGTKFNIFTHSFRYFGKDLIDLALPIF